LRVLTVAEKEDASDWFVLLPFSRDLWIALLGTGESMVVVVVVVVVVIVVRVRVVVVRVRGVVVGGGVVEVVVVVVDRGIKAWW